MNTIEIINELNKVECFKGVYPINYLLKLKFTHKPIGLVVNLDTSSLPGSHWVAIFIDKNNIGYYFDSFGLDIKSEFKYFFKKHRIEKLFKNQNMLQSFTSSSCGAYCVLFIKMMCSNFSFNEFLKLFTDNKNSNDWLVESCLLRE